MLVQTRTLSSCSIRLNESYHKNHISRTLGSARKSFTGISAWKLNAELSTRFCRCRYLRSFSSEMEKWNHRDSQLNGVVNICFRGVKQRGAIVLASEGQNSSVNLETNRKVVEHISLLKARKDLSDEEENDMLDYLYTSQYQMGGIVAISLGRISDQNLENYTHAVFIRFQRKEDLAKFYKNPFYLGVLRDHVMPYCHGLSYVDYESEVEDDILPIFRKGEEFNYGVEFMLLIAVVESALGELAEDALASLAKLTMEFPSLIVQATQGSNINPSSKEYTHGAVIRFRSIEAFEIFMGSSEYKDMWRSKFQQITEKTLSVHFSVDPVGTEIM